MKVFRTRKVKEEQEEEQGGYTRTSFESCSCSYCAYILYLDGTSLPYLSMTRFCTCPGSISSSLELRTKRNQPAEGSSCKTCGGRYLVDGIGPISGSMLGTVGLEVANSVNTELSWKTVTKGKRSRKQVARSLNGRPKLANKSPKRVGDFSGSDSDKFVELASGQPFQDRIEYVPIKKRRHLLRSPSPPPRTFSDGPESSSPQLPTPSSQSEDVEHSSDHNASSGQHSSGSYSNRQDRVGVGCRTDDGLLGDKVGGELYSAVDFSGIALLAAAACINNVDDDNDYVKGDVVEVSSALQVSNMSASSFPCGESISCSVSQGQLGKDPPLVEHKKYSSVVDCSVPGGHSSDKNEVCTMVNSVSSKVDRRHWDLNTLMEAWEEPHDNVAVGNKLTVEASVDGVQVHKLDSESSDAESEPTNNSNFENHILVQPLDRASEPSESETQDKQSEEFPCVDGLSSASNEDVDTKSLLCKKESVDNLPMAEYSHGSGPGRSIPDGIMGSTEMDTSEQKVVLSEVLGSEKSGNQNDFCMKNAEDAQKSIESPENSVENSDSTSEEHQHPSSKCEDLSTSDISIGSQSAAFGDGNGQEEKNSATDGRSIGAGMHPDCQKTISEHDDHLVSDRVEEKMSIQDSVKGSLDDDSHKSDVSQDGRVHLEENSDELQVDYDSPYEDGELRGSVLCCWDGNEHEHVDYGSDDRDGEDSDAGDCPGSEIVEAGSEGSQGTERNVLIHIAENNYRKIGSGESSLKKELNDNKEKIEVRAKKGLNQVSGSAHIPLTDSVMERSDGSLRRRRSSDCIDISDVKGYMGDVGPKATRGKLQSRIEGPSSVDIYERNIQEGRSRNIVGSLSRSERDGSPDRFFSRYRSSMHEHDRSGDSRWIYWDSRNRYPSSYRGLENHIQTRSRIGIVDSVDKFGGPNFHDHKQPFNHSSKGVQRQLVRRRSPVERVDIYGVHRRIAGINSHRNRGTSGNFSEGIGRGLRDEYNEPVIDDSLTTSGRMPHYLSRRDRSFSPPPGRVSHASAPHRKSRSRSRTQSPRAWQSQRERNLGTRRHSRSPELRPESRMDRMRVPFQKPTFVADYGESFMSPPRGRFSPQRSYRWVDNRNFVDDHLRHRRSPVGAFRRSQKLDHVGFSGRLKSDVHLRAIGRPGRFPIMDGIGRACKLEENGDDRRNDERSGMMQRGRHSEASAIMRRSRHDAEDHFNAGNLNKDDDVRSTDRRDVPRCAREDKRTFKV